MRLISETSAADLARQQAQADLEWPLRELAANVLRVVRGAGHPSRLGGQTVAVLNALNAYHDAAGCYPSDADISAVLKRTHENEPPGSLDERDRAIDTMVRGALQIAASDLVGQLAQSSRGDDELMSGFEYLLEIRERQRKEHAKRWK